MDATYLTTNSDLLEYSSNTFTILTGVIVPFAIAGILVMVREYKKDESNETSRDIKILDHFVE